MGRTILISSHILTEMKDFCTSIGIIEQGGSCFPGVWTTSWRRLETGLQLEIEVSAGLPKLMLILQTFDGRRSGGFTG